MFVSLLGQKLPPQKLSAVNGPRSCRKERKMETVVRRLYSSPPHPYFILMNPQRNELITPWVILLGRKAFPGLLAQTVAKSSDRVGEI